MTNGLDGLTSLSRSSDHLGNLANILKDLGGGATLLHELTQNANDARADEAVFTATPSELTVWNSATFSNCGNQQLRHCPRKTADGGRSCDLHSFRQVAGRHKADDDSTTGAFGVGFTAVYQVTDHPELVTDGQHLILDELKAEEDRISICEGGCDRDHAAVGTTFFLPWARGVTALRRELGATALDDIAVSEITDQMREASEAALIFLEHVEHLRVATPSGATDVVRRRDGERVSLTIDGASTEWLILEGLAAGADELKIQFDQGGSRSNRVQVAVPLSEAVNGRIFADLPTETRSGWGGHVNGTFFPRQDRKTVEFDGNGFRGKWNDMLLDTAAEILADHLATIADALGHPVAWTYVLNAEEMSRQIAKGELPTAFGSFFSRAKSVVPFLPIALLVDGTRTTPRGTLVPRDEVEYDAAELLTELGLEIIDPSIRKQILQISRTEYGIQHLGATHVVEALRAADLVEPWADGDDTGLPPAGVEITLRLLNHFAVRGKSILSEAGADGVAIIPCIDGSYAAASSVARLHGNDRALFELLGPELKILDEVQLDALCPGLVELCDDITPERAIEIFEADVDALSAAPDEVLEWLANHRSEVIQADLRERVSALPVFPSASGERRKLTELSLPSDFDDVLGVADVVDPEKVAGFTDLLRLLGATELDAAEYLTKHVAPVADAGGLDAELAPAVLGLIDRHRADLEDVRGALARLPLVPCTDGGVRPADEVHLPNRALSLIAPKEPIADVGRLGEYLRGTLMWLGVSDHPSHQVLNEAARRLGDPDAEPDPGVAAAILDALPNPPVHESVPSSLHHLRSAAWLPCNGGRRGRPADVYATFQQHLFASQGLQLDLPTGQQQRLTEVLAWLGIHRTPTTAMVIAHLRHCAENNQPMNAEVYRALGQAKEELLVSALRDRDCIQIEPGKFVGPGTVFWTDPGLGSSAHVLPAAAREQQALYDRVGVKETPTAEQIEQILRAISREVGNDRLGESDKAVVHRCWELLVDAVDSAGTVFERLSAIKSAIGPRDILEKPNLLLFTDGRRLAESIPLIRDNLIRRDKATHRALEAAGVKPAEDVITPNVDESLAFTSAKHLPEVLVERRPALERLAEAQRVEEVAVDLSRLDDIQIDEMPELAVEYVTRFAHRVHVDQPRTTEAIYFADGHRLIVRSDGPGRHVARELSLCIAPDADPSSLAPAIAEVLNAANLVDAMGALDDYGVRDLDSTTFWDTIASETVGEASLEVQDVATDGDPEARFTSADLPDAESPLARPVSGQWRSSEREQFGQQSHRGRAEEEGPCEAAIRPTTHADGVIRVVRRHATRRRHGRRDTEAGRRRRRWRGDRPRL